MTNFASIACKIKESIGLRYEPVAMVFAASKPEHAVGFNGKGNGCIAPLIFTAARGKTVAFDRQTTGFACSAFYLGYEKWIFEGIECFLSDGSVFGRSPERFIETPTKAKKYVESFIPAQINPNATVFKPLGQCTETEKPELVIFYANADEISGLVFALHYRYPDREDLVLTRFMSGCGSVVTYPMQLKAAGRQHAVWGMHDISVRKRLPKELMSLTIPLEMLLELHACLDTNFFITENWKLIRERNLAEEVKG
jgi:uncharacterized protein (DUF169 family)